MPAPRWFLFVLVLLLACVVRAAYVDPALMIELRQWGTADAIVTAKESPMEKDVLDLQARALDSVKSRHAVDEVEIKHRFVSFPAVAVRLTQDGLEALASNPWVQSIEWDRPVQAFTSISIPQINADDVHNRSVNGVSLTGRGQTICVLDTGIDYRHESLGACTPPTQTTLVNANRSRATDSAHPYDNNANNVFVINSTALGFGTFERIAVHFVNISTENAFDLVNVESPDGRILAQYSGVVTNFWSPSTAGDAIVVRLVSDSSTTGYGFTIDLVNNGSTDADVTWNCGKVIGGYDFSNNDIDPLDDNFHGTHVASTAAGNGTIRGVAPDAYLLAVKVLNAAGSGSLSTVAAGMDWCTTNRGRFNVTALSLSLGSNARFTSTCDTATTALAVSRAVSKGLLVAAATGNAGNTSSISQPACASLATAVGAVNAQNAVASFSNTWPNLVLLAPGNPVNAALFPANSTGSLSGTSMATPHVSGLSALLQQFAQSANGTRASPDYLRSLMNRTGVAVNDTRVNRFYYRVDALAALNAFSAEVTPRSLALASLTNGSTQTVNYAFVNVSFLDDANASTCQLAWNNGTQTNFSMTVNTPHCFVNVTNQMDVAANATVQITDAYNNTASLFFTTSFDALGPHSVSANVSNNSFLSLNAFNVSVSFIDAQSHFCTLSIDNANTTQAAVVSPCVFGVSLADGPHNLTGFVNDSLGRVNQTGLIQFTLDTTFPQNPSFVTPTPANTSFRAFNHVFYNATFVESNPDSCTLWRNGSRQAMARTGSTCGFNATALVDGQHDAFVELNDSAGHSLNSSLLTVIVDTQVPGVTAVSPTRMFANASTAVNVSISANDALASTLNVTLRLTNASGTVLYAANGVQTGSTYLFSLGVLSLASGNYTLNASASDTASNTASNASVNLTLDFAAPTRPILSVTANASGFVFLNWTASTDDVSFSHYALYRNGSTQLTGFVLNYSDRSVVSGLTYNYSVYAVDSASNTNASDFMAVTAFDSVFPLQTSNVTATNLGNGAVNLSWTNVTLDSFGVAENHVRFRIFRSDNTSQTNVSAMTELGNPTQLSFEDASELNASASYLYVVASFDAAGNFNSTLFSNNSINHTTASACTNAFSDFSACAASQQSRTRTCLGRIETQTQACSSGVSGSSGGAGGSSGGSPSASAGGGGASSGASSGGARGGGGGGGSGKDLFIVQNIPTTLELEPGKTQTVDAQVSSFYTGFLRVRNVTVSGVPDDWYTVNDLSLVSPISKTPFSIDWHPPAEARGNYSVRLDIIGVGTRNAGLLKTSFQFQLVLPPAESVKSSATEQVAPVLQTQTRPTPTVQSLPAPARVDYLTPLAVLAVMMVLGLAGAWVERWKWRNAHVHAFRKTAGKATDVRKAKKADAANPDLPTSDPVPEKRTMLPKKPT